MKKIAVVLSGCGVFDGSEIHEATLTLLAIKRLGAEYAIFAPDMPQAKVVNHATSQAVAETRNVLVESARIARGSVAPLSAYDASQFDGLVFPGGFGAALNLCTWAVDGPNCTVHPDVERAIRTTRGAGKPIGALCIAPVLLAKLIPGVKVTIGKDPGTAQAVESAGAKHVESDHCQVVSDLENKVFTGPCYMLDADITQIADGAQAVVQAMLDSM